MNNHWLFGKHRLKVPPMDAPFMDVFRAQEIAEIVQYPAFEYRSAHRHNGQPMVPPSAVQYVERWESAHGDNVEILTEEEIATLRKIGSRKGENE